MENGSDGRAILDRKEFLCRLWLKAAVYSAVIVGLLLLWQAAYVLLLGFAAVLLAILFCIPIDYFQRRFPISRGISLALTLVIALIVFGSLFSIIVPRLRVQAEELITVVPQSTDRLMNQLRETRLGQFALSQIDLNRMPRIIGKATSTLSSGMGAIIGFLIILSLAIYFALNSKGYVSGVVRLAPPSQRRVAERFFYKVGDGLRAWMLGQLTAMAAIGAVTGIGLYLLGVPLALTLGLLAFLLDFVPYFGPILAAIPAVLIALGTSWTKALYVVLLYFLIQQFEGIVAAPLIQKRAVSLPPVLTIISITLFGTLFGPFGFILAEPLMVVVMIAVKILYIESVLGENPETS